MKEHPLSPHEDDEPELTPQEGWISFEPFPSKKKGSLHYFPGEPEQERFKVKYFKREHDGAAAAKVWFGPGTEGGPGVAHGGAILTVLDHVLGMAAWIAGHVSVTGRLITEFRKRVPIGTVASLVAWVESVEGKKVVTRCRMTDEQGDILAEGKGLFVIVSRDLFNQD